MMTTTPIVIPTDSAPDMPDLATLQSIERKVLWLSTLMIHHANNVRPNPDKSKVGGHQASSASSVSLITALYFHFLKAGDRIAVKPHAAPALHAAMYLLGHLQREHLTTLREFGGLQSYPSRSKDPFPLDYAGGSMGMPPAAALFSALTSEYVRTHFGASAAERFVLMSGDAELDEGNLWEALLDETLKPHLSRAIWIVDYNRQSLDRVMPGARSAKLRAIYEACGWRVIDVKYGAQLQDAFARPGGDALRWCIDEMSNEQYQSLIRSAPALIRETLYAHDYGVAIKQCLDSVADDALANLLSNLGGHDIGALLDAFALADDAQRPTVIFAYTIKGYGLPIAGDPANHAALLSTERFEQWRASLNIAPDAIWDSFAPGSPESRLCAARSGLFDRPVRAPSIGSADIPAQLDAVGVTGVQSTQEAFGRIMLRLADVPKLGERIITTSPDVSVSTNLGGWINKVGAFAEQQPDYEAHHARTLNWKHSPRGQHVEFGIAEMNLFTALAAFGLSHEHTGELLLPIGTVYDPFVARGLDAIIYGLYSHSRFIWVATPSGVSLAPEGGAHQSTVTASLGIELPNTDFWEPCFALEAEWALLEALRQCTDRAHGRSSYLRLSTKPIDQTLIGEAIERLGMDQIRTDALAGGYILREAPDASPALVLATTGAMVPECVEAAAFLNAEGLPTRLLHLTSPRRAYENRAHLSALLRGAHTDGAVLSVHDAASHALAWLGSASGLRAHALGVDKFGQCGYRGDLYRYMGIDVTSICAAGFALFDA
jgi:pyruvate dehydrogenase E1 component